MLGLTFSSKLDWSSYIISIAKTVSKKFGALIRSMKFLSPRLLCISINLPYGHVQNTVVMSELVLLVATCNCQMSYRNEYAGTVGPLLAASLEPLAHCRNVASLSLFYRYYFGRFSSELPYSQGKSTHHFDRLHDFSVTIPRCYEDVLVSSFFPRTARLWNSLRTECFSLTYNLSGLKSRINRHLLTLGSF